MTDYDFVDQVALITGGGRGLGQTFGEELAQAGATVARSEMQLRDAAQAIVQVGGRVLAFTADVTDRQAIEHVVAELEWQWEHTDVLVNNAGICRAPDRSRRSIPMNGGAKSRSTGAAHICARERSCLACWLVRTGESSIWPAPPAFNRFPRPLPTASERPR